MNATKRTKRLIIPGLFVLVVAGGALGVVALRGRDGAPPAASEATAPAGRPVARRATTDSQIETLQARLTSKRDDPELLATLGGAYLQKVRETANPTWYGKAETVLKRALVIEPNNGEALNGLGQLALSRHQFREALDWAERAIAVAPYRAANYGIAGDALVELGRYDEAVTRFQTMVDTRPDLSSYSRVSYIRELYGRTDGAVEAMRMAVNAGGGAPENSAYVRALLGNLYFNGGRLDEAEREYQLTLVNLPSYGPALAGMAQVRAARGDDSAAIDLLTKASEALPLPEYAIALGDLYTRNGRKDEAARQYELVKVIEKLFAANGTDVDVETALFDADHGFDLPGALARAREGYQRRPSIHAADVLAWTLYQSGKAEEAEPYVREALRLGTKDALKLYHAGVIARALGKTAEARTYLEQAVAINPNFSLLHAADAQRALATLARAGAVGSGQ